MYPLKFEPILKLRQGEGDKGTMKFEEFAKILNEEVQNMINKW